MPALATRIEWLRANAATPGQARVDMGTRGHAQALACVGMR